MSKAEYEGLLQITDRATALLVVWKKAFLSRGQKESHPRTIQAVNEVIAELAEYRQELKQLLRGEDRMSAGEKFQFILAEIEAARDADTRKLYVKRLMDLTNRIMAGEILEDIDVDKG